MKPPDDIYDWVLSKDLLTANLMIFKMDWFYDPLTEQKVRMVKVTCSECKEVVYCPKAEGVVTGGASPVHYGFRYIDDQILKSYDTAMCQYCYAPVKVMHTGSVKTHHPAATCWPMTITRFENKLVLIGWRISKHIDRDAEVTFEYRRYEAYVIEEKRIVRLVSYGKSMYNLYFRDEWVQRKKFFDEWKMSDLFYPWDVSLLEGSTAENSKLDKLIADTTETGCMPVTYLRYWQQRPQIENLVMQGASPLITEMMDSSNGGAHYRTILQSEMEGFKPPKYLIPHLGHIDWREVEPAKMLGMTKPEFRSCVANKWDEGSLYYYLEDKKHFGRNLTNEELTRAHTFGFSRCRQVRNEGEDWIKVEKYLVKQRAKDDRIDFSILEDYWDVAKKVGEDLSIPIIRYPTRLMHAHDKVELKRQRLIKIKETAEMKKRKALFDERFKELSEFVWETEQIIIRPVRTETELKKEGKMNDHCVGSYAESHATGKRAMFLIRKVDMPDLPWFTLEFDVKKLSVIQNRGKKNCEPTPEVKEFVTAWINLLKEKRKAANGKKAKRKPAGKPHLTAVS